MRPAFILASLIVFAASAQAEPLSVNKGQWAVSQDIYYEASASGEKIDIPSEHSSVEECWSQDEEVLIDESMVEMFEGCVSTGATAMAYGLDIGLSCNFDGLEVNGSALFSLSHDRDSFVAQVNLASPPEDIVDFRSHMLMIGHRSGTCAAPG